MANQIPWIKQCFWAFLSFIATFVIGGGGSLLWSSYAGEMPRGLTPLEHEQQEKENCNEVERNALTAGLIGGIGGALICLIILKLRKKNQ